MTAMAAQGPKLFPIRRRTGTAAYHLSREAVDFGAEDLEKLTPKEGVMFVAKLLWGSTKEMPCPHCGTIDAHYWSLKELRWKCTCCGKRFSVTSGTVLSGRKLPLVKILKIAYDWSTGASGVPALQLQKKWNTSYPTVFTLIHKLREGILRGHNAGMLCGVHEMDGMDVNGRRHKEKRNVPQGGRPKGVPKIPDELLAPTDNGPDFIGPPTPPKFGKTTKQHPDRRIMLVMRQRGISKGKGGAATRIAIGLSECGDTVTKLTTTYASAESIIVSDEGTSYAAIKSLFAGHFSVKHAKEFSTVDGVNNNQAESFNRRMRRGVEGGYSGPS